MKFDVLVKTLVLWMLTAMLLCSGGAQAKTGHGSRRVTSISDTAHKGTARGRSNIKSGRAMMNRGNTGSRVSHKIRTGMRGGLGTIHVDSRSRYYIDIYIDGSYAGTVGPGGDLYLDVSSGEHTLYGDAAGTPYDWGPRVGFAGSLLWTIG